MTVVAALTDLKKYTQKKYNANISTTIFKLHRLTCSFLLCCSALTTSRQFFGNNIHCMLGTSEVPKDLFESFCFMRSTYTLSHTYSNSTLYSHAQPGVYAGDYGTMGAEDGASHHNYYQWVCLLLVIQACICYIPWSAWKHEERGRIAKLIEKVNKDPLTEVPVAEQVTGLASFIANNAKWFDSLALKLLGFQFLCLVFTIGQLYIMDIVLGHQFLHLGTHVLDWDAMDKAMEVVFPLVVSCQMNYMGPSGEPQATSGMCTLPINIVNEKIYLIIWLWYLILIIVTIFSLLWNLTLFMAPYLRQLNLNKSCQSIPAHQIKGLIRRCSYGDYILLRTLADNIDSTQYNALVKNLCESFSHLRNHHGHNSTMSTDAEQYAAPEKIYSGHNNQSRLYSSKQQ